MILLPESDIHMHVVRLHFHVFSSIASFLEQAIML